jgi:hypothetical protein
MDIVVKEMSYCSRHYCVVYLCREAKLSRPAPLRCSFSPVDRTFWKLLFNDVRKSPKHCSHGLQILNQLDGDCVN